MRRIREPICVVGVGRSGTGMIARILRQHPNVAYLGEPRPVWMHGHAYRRDHALAAEDLTPRIARYIDGEFARFLKRSGRGRFMEKTPSNCLRIPFIQALYPDVRIINIIRDGRAVVRSQLKLQERGPRRGLVRSRMRETRVWEWPAYLPMFLRTVWWTKVLGRTARFWGPKPPGWWQWLHLPPHVIAARQWRSLVETSIRDGRVLPAENYLEIRYERLLAEPEAVVKDLVQFTGLDPSEEVVTFTRGYIDPSRHTRWAGTLDDQQAREVEQEMQPLLEELGYS